MKIFVPYVLAGFMLLISFTGISAQTSPYFDDDHVLPRARVIIDNDFGGDPDGLMQLAHHILSNSVEIRGIIASRHYENGFYDNPGTASFSFGKMTELLEVLELEHSFPLYIGSETQLKNQESPVRTKAAEVIIREAMRTDTDLPLFVVCGGGLTNIASAWLMEPSLAKNITLIWIGGPEYTDLANPPPNTGDVEYNLGIDINAARVVFNQSEIPVWQVPRDAYRQTLVSYAEILQKVKPQGELGEYLTKEFFDLKLKAGGMLGEAYAMGDNPLVLLSALTSTWNPDPSSSKYSTRKAPVITNEGVYRENPSGREIRVYTDLDVRLMMEDFYAKLAIFHSMK